MPYKGAAEAVTEIVAGRIDFSPQLPTTTVPLINDGKLSPLAVSAAQAHLDPAQRADHDRGRA